MNSLVAFFPQGTLIEAVRDQLLARGFAVDFRNGRITVSHEGSVAWVEPDLDGELGREYEPGELAIVEEVVGNWIAFVIDYRSIGAADAIVATLCEKWPCAVDNDDGFIGQGIDYLKRRREG